MTLVKPGENIIVIERRAFDGDIRRHFVGQVEAATNSALRAVGYTFVCNSTTGNFDRRDPVRTRIVPLSAGGLVLYVIPPEIDVKAVRHEWAAGNRLVMRAPGWEFFIDEFANTR